MFGVFLFSETAPSTASSAASSQVVQGSDNLAANGILSSAEIEGYELLSVVGEFGGNTGGTLDVYVQTFYNGHWYDFCHIKQVTAGGAVARVQYVAGRATQTNGTVIGIDNTPALANDTIVGGVWGEKFRLWMVSGASTTVGAAVKVYILGQIMRNAKR